MIQMTGCPIQDGLRYKLVCFACVLAAILTDGIVEDVLGATADPFERGSSLLMLVVAVVYATLKGRDV